MPGNLQSRSENVLFEHTCDKNMTRRHGDKLQSIKYIVDTWQEGNRWEHCVNLSHE